MENPMKSLFKVSLLAATVMLAVGCQKEEAPKTETTPAAQTAAAKTVEFKSEDDKAAYAIGVSFANYLKTSIEKPSEIGIDLNKDLVLKGIEHVFAGNPEMSEEETRAALEALDKRVAETMQAKAAEKAAENKKKGDEFRAQFEKESGVVKTQSGLLYQVMTPAEGDKPKDTDTVQV
ncbi:fkbp-type peptidyl-prolyl cis-trans isomerase fkpa, partial [Vibrio cholerae NCTC 8457]